MAGCELVRVMMKKKKKKKKEGCIMMTSHRHFHPSSLRQRASRNVAVQPQRAEQPPHYSLACLQPHQHQGHVHVFQTLTSKPTSKPTTLSLLSPSIFSLQPTKPPLLYCQPTSQPPAPGVVAPAAMMGMEDTTYRGSRWR